MVTRIRLAAATLLAESAPFQDRLRGLRATAGRQIG
jgi:hypothetical protein